MDDRTKKLLAVGASVGANCHLCLEYHVGRALESGIDRSEILAAVGSRQRCPERRDSQYGQTRPEPAG